MVDRETDHDEMVDEREEKVVDHEIGEKMVNERDEMVDFDPSQVFNKIEDQMRWLIINYSSHNLPSQHFICLTTYHLMIN